MTTTWFYERDGEKIGPIPGKTLRDLAACGAITPTTNVWKSEMLRPVPASRVSGLFPVVAQAESTAEASGIDATVAGTVRELPVARRLNEAQPPSFEVPPGLRVNLDGPGTFALAIVGESHYEEALEAICGSRKPEGEDRRTEAQLVLESDNPYDPLAVRVVIAGLTVGYLDRETARSYRKALAATGYTHANAWCNARIRGGWDHGEDDRGHYGVWLDLPMKDD